MNKIIHQVFIDVGLQPLNERKDYLKSIEILKKINPTWKHMLWTDENANKLVKEEYPEYLKIWNNFPNPFYKIDYIRYLILHKYGGVYIDLDEENIKPLDDFLECTFIFGGFVEKKSNKKSLNNNIISINDKVYTKKLIDYCNEQIVIRDNSIPDSWKIRKFLHRVGANMFKRFCKMEKLKSQINTRLYFKQIKSKDTNLSWILALGGKINYKDVRNKQYISGD